MPKQKTVNIHDAKTHFSKLLRRVERGEEVTIARDGRPVARLIPLAASLKPRVPGTASGEFWMSADFDAPVPEIERAMEE